MHIQTQLSALLVLTFSLVSAEWNTRDYARREHTLIRPYQGQGLTLPYWDISGSTLVTANYIRLTPDLQSKQGSLWNTVDTTCASRSTVRQMSYGPGEAMNTSAEIHGYMGHCRRCYACHTRHWELQVQFKIHGRGKELFGDGLAIWYTRERMRPGPVFGNMDYFTGLGVILDTYSNHNGAHNHQHPYISAMVSNGTLHYDHDRDGTHTQLAGCEAKLRNVDKDTYISIKYVDDTLTVSTDLAGKNHWRECLSVRNVRLPTGYYFGVSAATGDLSDNHDVIGIRMYELESETVSAQDEDRSRILPSAETFEAPRERVEDEKPSWSGVKTFFMMVLAIISAVAVCVVGIMYYQKRQEHSRKRLY